MKCGVKKGEINNIATDTLLRWSRSTGGVNFYLLKIYLLFFLVVIYISIAKLG